MVTVSMLGVVYADLDDPPPRSGGVLVDGDGTAAGDYLATQEAISAATQDTCLNVCGDVNNSGSVTSADIIAYMKYLNYALLLSSNSHDCNEMDGHQSLNMRDVLWLARFVFQQFPAPTCPANLPPYVVQPSADYWLRLADIVPAGASRVRIYPEFKSLARFASVSADITVDVEGVTPWIDSASRTQAPPGDPWTTHYLYDFNGYTGDTAGVVMINMMRWNFSLAIDPGTYPLGFFEIILPPAPYARRISYTLQGFPEGDNAPMMVDTALVGWEIHVETYSVRKTGDANNDGVLTASDVIGLVNYIFKGGATPHPIPATGDCNCSGSVTSADIIVTVNHVFKGGAPPCDVEAECTIDLEEWSCP